MVDDIKSLAKKYADLEKRLKFSEAKIKVVADSLTSAKDIEKYLDVLQRKIEKDMRKGIEVSEKANMREFDMSQKALDARDKENEKEYQQQRKEDEKIRKENEKFRKAVERQMKESIRQSEFITLQARIAALEGMVAALGKR